MHIRLTYLIFLVALVFNMPAGVAQSSGDYRSTATGNWNSTAAWQTYNGSSWIAASSIPSTSGVITIRSGNTVTITANVTVTQVVDSSGGEIIINDGITLTLNSGATTTLDVYGTLEEIGTGSTGAVITINSGATIVFESSSLYEHNFSSTITQGSIPIATWLNGSTCEMTGFTGNGANIHAANFNQSFYNFIWNCPNETSAYGMQGLLTTVRGNFTMQNSGNPSQIVYGRGASAGGLTMNIGGNMIISGGIFDFANSAATGTYILNIGENYTQTGGTFQNDLASGMAVHFTGPGYNFTQSGGTLTSKYMNFYVDNEAILILNSNIPVSTSFTVSNGGTLNCGTYIMSGGGTFTLSSGGTLGIGSSNGITSSGASGNIQVTGTRSFNTGGNYTYYGSTAQNSGNGLPAQVNNLTLNNSANCTLSASASVAGTMYLSSGIWIATTDTLTLGISTSTLGTLSIDEGYVDGYFRRWIAATTATNILFPVGTLIYYNGANFSFTTAPTTGGSIVSTFIPINPGTLGLPLLDAGDLCVSVGYGYWNFGAANGFAGGTYNVNLYANGFLGITDYTVLHIFQRTSGGYSWTTNGTHTAGTGSNTAPVVNRLSMTLLQNYGIVSPIANPLPVELISFDATPEAGFVRLSWATASEINNDYFTVERSDDGISFDSLLFAYGAGTSTNLINYTATDAKPLDGDSYYRLRQTDFDGHCTFSATVHVYISRASLYNIFPNPSSGNVIYISKNGEDLGDVNVIVHDQLGQEVEAVTKLSSNKKELQVIIAPFSFNKTNALIVSVVSAGDSQREKVIIKQH